MKSIYTLSKCTPNHNTGTNDGPLIWGNGARNIYSNSSKMRAYVECSSINQNNQILSTFPSSNRQNFEDSRKVLAVSVFEFCQMNK